MASSEPREIVVAGGVEGRGRTTSDRHVVRALAGIEHETFVVVPVSSSRAPSLLRPRISLGEGIDSESAAICRGVRAVSRSRLLRRIGRLKPATLREVEQALAMILGIDGRSVA